MCGIAGAYRSTWDLDAALKRIRHRGPDGIGIVEHEHVRHGHVRLAVIDLTTASDQPFRYRDAVLSFNRPCPAITIGVNSVNSCHYQIHYRLSDTPPPRLQ